jgi:hypothetical protein
LAMVFMEMAREVIQEQEWLLDKPS